MYKHLSCAAFKIKLTTGSSNAGACEKNSTTVSGKKPVCVQALLVVTSTAY